MAGTNTPTSVDPHSATHKVLVKKLEALQRSRPPSNKAELEQKVAESVFLRLNNEFGVLNCQDGDSLLYIGPPPQTLAESRTWDHSYIQHHFSFPHRVHSRKFLCLGSKKFQDLFGPRSNRTERRFRKDGVLSRVPTEGIRFFVDLRPPTEDDEAVILLTTLTCTKGVLTWHMAQEIYGLSSLLVAGQDDSSTISAGLPLPTAPLDNENDSDKSMLNHPKSPSGNLNPPLKAEIFDTRGTRHAEDLIDLELQGKDTDPRNDNGSTQNLSTTPLLAPVSTLTKSGLSKTSNPKIAATTSAQLENPACILPEYSPLRHRSAIERLVQAIENGDPKLDSAPKVWTFFAVAKYFDCASHERINGWITKWLLSYPNSNFIQCNPEVALRIGLGTQSESVTKNALSILVGEKSLLNVFGESNPSILTPLERSVHGRRLELLDDDERNRIDHAAASLVRRIRQGFDDLVGDEMAWLQQSSYYKRLTSLVPHNQEEAEVVEALIQKIKQFVRGRINWVLCRTYDDDFSEFEQQLKRVRAFYPNTPDTFRGTYNMLNERERIFTRFFWVALNQESFADGKINLWTERVSKLGLPDAGSTYLSQKMLDRTMPSGQRMCQVVSKKELNALVTELNETRRRHGANEMRTAKQSLFETLPIRDTEAVPPTKHEFHVREEQSADTTHQSSRGQAYNSFNGFKSLHAAATSPKRDQPAVPYSQLTEKRRKLSDADLGGATVPATGSATESLPFRSRASLANQYEESSTQGESLSPYRGPESPFIQGLSLVQRDKGTNGDGAEENMITSLHTELPYEPAPPAGEATTYSQAENFGHNDFWSRNFQPVLPKLPASRLSTKDATFHQHLDDVSRKLNLFADQNNGQDEVMAFDDWAVQADVEDSSHVNTDTGYFNSHYGNPKPIITAADWSLPADDIDWTAPQLDQHLGNHLNTQQTYFQPAYVVLPELLDDLSNVLHSRCHEILYPAHLFHGDNLLPTNLIDNLMCLEDDEWKYLPLWAGGNDDGTGGVFDEVDVPNLEAGGFKGGKRGMGSISGTGATSSASDSSFDDVGSDAISTVGKASKAATDGTQTVMSLSDVGSEDEDFMRQNEIWDEIRNMKAGGAQPVRHGNETTLDKGKARAEECDDGFDEGMDEQDADDVDTITGARSSSDGNEDIYENEERDTMNEAIHDNDSEDDMEIVNVEDL